MYFYSQLYKFIYANFKSSQGKYSSSRIWKCFDNWNGNIGKFCYKLFSSSSQGCASGMYLIFHAVNFFLRTILLTSMRRMFDYRKGGEKMEGKGIFNLKYANYTTNVANSEDEIASVVEMTWSNREDRCYIWFWNYTQFR